MTQIHVLFTSGAQVDFVAVADCEPSPMQQPADPYPETIWISTTGIGGVQDVTHAHVRSADVAAIWQTED